MKFTPLQPVKNRTKSFFLFIICNLLLVMCMLSNMIWICAVNADPRIYFYVLFWFHSFSLVKMLFVVYKRGKDDNPHVPFTSLLQNLVPKFLSSKLCQKKGRFFYSFGDWQKHFRVLWHHVIETWRFKNCFTKLSWCKYFTHCCQLICVTLLWKTFLWKCWGKQVQMRSDAPQLVVWFRKS